MHSPALDNRLPIAPARSRDAFFDVVRAIAIVRVVAWHTFQWPALSYVAAMPVMFFVGGTMARSSFERRPALLAVRSRLRRLLPSLWIYGAFAWAAFLFTGLGDGSASSAAARLVWWILPLWDPTGPDAALAWWAPLWYLRAYLWFVLLTPLLIRWLRKHGAPRVLAMAGVAASFAAAVSTARPEALPPAARDLALYGAFWTVGLATPELRATPAFTRRRRVALAAALAASGVAWMVVHHAPLGIVNASPVAELLLGAAWIAAFTAAAPAIRRLTTRPWLNKPVAALNHRAVSIYLWHCAAIVLAHEAVDAMDLTSTLRTGVVAVLVVLLTMLFVALVGPVEDLASTRGRSTASRAREMPRPWSAAMAVAVLTCVAIALAAVPIVDLRNADGAYVPASGRGLDRLISANAANEPRRRTPVVRGSGPVTPGEVDAIVAAWQWDWDMTGVIAAVGRSDGAALSAAAGIDTATGTAMRADQIIPAHSITKSFTGALIAELAAEHFIDLDERLAVWVPEFPHASRMSLRQLAQHSSGLVDTGQSPAVAIAIAGSTPLLFEPGHGTQYADSAYFLLAVVAERASGQPYAQLVSARLLQPLGLDHTTLDVGPRWSAGGMLTTAQDLVRWAPAFWGGGLGEGVAVEARALDPNNNFGVGTFGYCPCDGTGTEYVPQLYGHLSAQGRLAWDPIEDLAVMVHTNEENDGDRTIDAWTDLDERLRQLVAGRPIVNPQPAAP